MYMGCLLSNIIWFGECSMNANTNEMEWYDFKRNEESKTKQIIEKSDHSRRWCVVWQMPCYSKNNF